MFNFQLPRFSAGFEAAYRAYPVSFTDKVHAENGDKVILPPSALDKLASLHVEYPMLFRVESRKESGTKKTHCGVLEFTAEEGMVYLPYWMMGNLLIAEGDVVFFTNVSLPKGTYVKLQPLTSDFLDISNPKAVLEMTLRSYTCLTLHETFMVNYNDKKYYIDVVELKPQDAVSVIETDCEVDFAAPKDYVEPPRVQPPAPIALPQSSNGAQPMQDDGAEANGTEEPSFIPFKGAARRLDGRPLPPGRAVSDATTAQRAVFRTSTGFGSGQRSTSGIASGSDSGASTPRGSSSGAAAAAPSGPKPGKHVFQNRLLAKLGENQQQPAAPKPPEPPVEDKEPKFKAFSGTARKLK